jgi:hypothetical protein
VSRGAGEEGHGRTPIHLSAAAKKARPYPNPLAIAEKERHGRTQTPLTAGEKEKHGRRPQSVYTNGHCTAVPPSVYSLPQKRHGRCPQPAYTNCHCTAVLSSVVHMQRHGRKERYGRATKICSLPHLLSSAIRLSAAIHYANVAQPGNRPQQIRNITP